ncbi:MAG: amino acid adenylation domain-containing protein [Bacteroidota bacterium]
MPDVMLTADHTAEARTVPLTTNQLLMWTGQKLHPTVPLYNMVHTFEITGALDPVLLERAWQALLDRSDALRTVVLDTETTPVQHIRAPFAYPMEQVDLSGAPSPDEALDAWVRARCATPLDASVSVFDTALVRLGEARHVWYLNQHHLITDIWATALIYRQVEALYQHAAAGTLDAAPSLPAFADYVAHAEAFQATPRAQKAQAFWAAQREALPPPPPLYGCTASQLTPRTARHRVDLGHDRSTRLRALAQRPDLRALTPHLTHFSLFASLLFAYMHRVSGQRQLALGTPTHNRPSASFKETIGPFIEVFPFGLEIDEGETFHSLVKKVQRDALPFFRHALPGTSHAAANRAYNVLLNYLPVSFSDTFGDFPMRSDWIHTGYGDAQHHLRLQVHDLDATGAFQLYFDLNADLFEVKQREAATHHFVALLEALLDDPATPLSEVPLLTEAEHAQQLRLAQPASALRDVPLSILPAFQAQVAQHPARTALRMGEQTLTYAELDARSTELAHRLRGRGVDAGDRVALCMERSPSVLVALLGAMKVGAAYVPLDPAHPTERLAATLRDAEATLVLADALQIPRWAKAAAEVVDPVALLAAPIEARHPLPPVAPDQTAYVLYTSGSTGQPKGVRVPHQALAHYVTWAADQYAGGAPIAMPLFTSLGFDLTVTSLFVPLLVGGEVVVYADEASAASTLLRVIEDDAVDVIKLTPSHAALLRGQTRRGARLQGFILGGEDLKVDTAQALQATFGVDAAIYNEYGPTEATVGCMIHRYDPTRDTGPSVPIGRPGAQAQIYVLDKHRRPVPDGLPGELYVGGPGVADGYLGRPALTAERFIDHPFEPGARLYRTGDLARRLPHGPLVYLGRRDQQVKIRGHRVELGEVEAALLAHPGIEEVVVRPHTPDLPAAPVQEETHYCVRCGLTSAYPGITFDAHGLCHLCRRYDLYRDNAEVYFRPMEELRRRLTEAQTPDPEGPQALVLLSGGKDSTYMLAKVVEMGVRAIAFTLDNGYISEGAKDNIRRVTEALGVEHVFGTTAAMNAIFVDSLERYSNVCQGCFKTIYTLAIRLARRRGIPYIITGLSRGQFFETRLTEELFLDDTPDNERIDLTVLEARRAYHRTDDAVSRLLNTTEFDDDALFEQVQFLDFYRFCDVSLDTMLTYLNERLPWVRPSDTGRSTNCLINDAGIYVHKREQGYHNYAFPYSWDVRVGHKERNAALDELDDDLDMETINRILGEIGYTPKAPAVPDSATQLVGYYVSAEPLPLPAVRSTLAAHLPEAMRPAHLIRLEALPLTPNGKVDLTALPPPTEGVRPDLEADYAPPRSEAEHLLARLWAEALQLDRVGVHDNFFDLGGESILAIQISARAAQAGLPLPISLLFRHQTIAELAAAAEAQPRQQAEQGLVTGAVPLTPIQHWFFEHQGDLSHWNNAWLLDVAAPLDLDALRQALGAVLRHHDALRLQFVPTDDGWTQTLGPMPASVPLTVLDLRTHPDALQALAAHEREVHASFRLDAPPLLRLTYVRHRPDQADQLLLVAHHLVIDGLSWGLLIQDLGTAYAQAAAGDALALPAKTTSVQAWSDALLADATREPHPADLTAWQDHLALAEAPFGGDAGRAGDAHTHRTHLSPEATDALLGPAQETQRARIDELLLAALSHALRALTGGPGQAGVDVEGHGRDVLEHGPDVSRTVGWFTALTPVVLDLRPDTPAELLRAVKDRWRALPTPRGRHGLLHTLRPAETQAPASPARVLFNYLGPLGSAIPETSLQARPARPLSLSQAPDLQRRYALDVNAHVEDGQLHVAWTFHPALHPIATVHQAAAAFNEAVHALTGTDAPAPVTASDFPLAGLDDTKMNKLAALLRRTDRR